MSSDERESLLQRTGNTEIKVDMKQPSDIESSSETKVTETIAVLQQPRPPTEARYLYSNGSLLPLKKMIIRL